MFHIAENIWKDSEEMHLKENVCPKLTKILDGHIACRTCSTYNE